MSDNSEVVIKQVSPRKFILHRRDVDIADADPSYIGYYIGVARSIKEATKMAEREATAEYGYTIEWLEDEEVVLSV